MKGVIYKIAPDAKIVDLCHDISPQNIIEASWILKNNYMYFPEGAVFCCVVDPGVGTQRKALAVRTEDYYFVAPDNGILWETLKHQRIIEIRQIPVPPDASRTFHGRDVFAKAAVNIDLGNFNEVGEKIKEIEKLELYQNQRQGIVVRIDRFGNIVTNLTKQDKDEYSLQIADRKYVMNFYPDYDSANEGDLFLIEGSCNTLEISLKNGNAVDKLNVKVGEKITIS
jgi:S-adenosylmethionine hydrolase